MIKYDVKNFEAFFSSIALLKPIYIEKNIDNFPIPELQGFIYPFFKDGNIKIATVIYDENNHMKYDKFKHMIISCKLTGDTMAKIFEIADSVFIYNFFKNEYNLFVLDDTYDKIIENNN